MKNTLYICSVFLFSTYLHLKNRVYTTLGDIHKSTAKPLLDILIIIDR